MPLVSIIVPTRLRNHLLPRAVQSLLAQTFNDIEILVVDDNPPESPVSTDKALVKLLQEPRIRLLTHDQPRNAAAARNVALAVARGEWITYLDDDDAYHPAKIERQLQRARESALPAGVCGMTYHLARRARTRIIPATEVGGSDLILIPFALPTIFHRHVPGLRFDENLSAGEDAYFFYELVDCLKTTRIFNVPESLVDVYPQPGPRVHTNAEGLWQACQAVYRDFGAPYGRIAAETFLVRSRLSYLKYQAGGLSEMLHLAWKLSSLRPFKETRFILNALLFKARFLRRFLVH